MNANHYREAYESRRDQVLREVASIPEAAEIIRSHFPLREIADEVRRDPAAADDYEAMRLRCFKSTNLAAVIDSMTMAHACLARDITCREQKAMLERELRSGRPYMFYQELQAQYVADNMMRYSLDRLFALSDIERALLALKQTTPRKENDHEQ